MEVDRARELARELLAESVPGRWHHVQGVARRAELFAHKRGSFDLLVAAAHLHDIGYSPAVVDTGFHQIDGARLLRRRGWDERIVNLVAHHSAAARIAKIAGLGDVLNSEFPRLDELPHRELHYCDLTTSPDGAPITVDARLAGMRRRHRNNPVMTQFLDQHESALRSLAFDVERDLDAVPPRQRPPLSQPSA